MTSLPNTKCFSLVEDLIELASTDTVFRDLYLGRARDFLMPVFSEAEYESQKRSRREASNLPNLIQDAMEQGNWREVRDLSSRFTSFRQTLAENEALCRLGQKIYETGDTPLDPFSLGLQHLTNLQAGKTQQLWAQSKKRLQHLELEDGDWQLFYRDRAQAISELNLESQEASTEKNIQNDAQLYQDALEALNNCNFKKLEQLASNLINNEDQTKNPEATSIFTVPDLSFNFPQDVLIRARGLGLAAVRVKSDGIPFNLTKEKKLEFYRYITRQAFSGQNRTEQSPSWMREGFFTSETPIALRELITSYSLHPFINSGGTRILPFLVEEDVLIEDFEDPDPGISPKSSGLLSALGFENRWGLSRASIEQALFKHGNRILNEIGLDERIFRLVCIPPDLYSRLGIYQGWGTKPFWTHFDGYLVTQNRGFRPLAGGDVRFGGLYDWVGIGKNYDSNHIIARFAVVQRSRMMEWGLQAKAKKIHNDAVS